MNNNALAGAGALMVYLRTAHIRDDATIKTFSVDDMRNTMIAEINKATGKAVPDLQRMGNFALVNLTRG
ncbi:MAG: hypothetical protein ABIH03_13205 [Pseudomonadota bacterium]|uniref:hypothetical protein n=1 Tax=Roseixanthobacter finlandensis TaxID=3119922 RepID=UPI003726A37E